jgi:hypothetical protein
LVLAGKAGEQQLVTLTAAKQRLFWDERPIQENAREYLPILAGAMKNVPESSGSTAALLFFQLLDPLPFASRQNSCVTPAQPAK